jgi:hypothetical protein
MAISKDPEFSKMLSAVIKKARSSGAARASTSLRVGAEELAEGDIVEGERFCDVCSNFTSIQEKELSARKYIIEKEMAAAVVLGKRKIQDICAAHVAENAITNDYVPITEIELNKACVQRAQDRLAVGGYPVPVVDGEFT